MKPLNEGNPSELLDLAAEVQRGFDETGKLPVRLMRERKQGGMAGVSLASVH